MFNRTRGQIGAVAIGLMVLGVAIGTGQAGSSSGPLSCEIRTTPTNGGVTLESIIRADIPLEGSYRFQVTSAGSVGGSNIQQGGNFAVGSNGAATLGRVTLGGNTTYETSLEATSGGITVKCDERISGAI